MGLDLDQTSHVPGTGAPFRHCLLPIAIAFISLLAELGGDATRELLRYARTEIADGQWWRLISGHLVHLGWSHFLMNVAALLLIWMLVGRYLHVTQWLKVLLATLLGIDAGFWLLDTQLIWYVGLSGVLHGMLAAGIVAGFRESRVEMFAMATLLILKLAYEQYIGALPGSAVSAGGAVVVNAHLYGTVSGTVGALFCGVRVKRQGSI
jgi:rhomboid family GlyGly-CTERM serine protease